MQEEVTEGQMGLMRGLVTMAAPRKYSKTTELRLIRGCQMGWDRAVVEVGCDPLGFEGVDASPGAAEDSLAYSTSSMSSKGNCRVSSPRCPGAKMPSATVMDDVSVTVEH
ncbi:hypothetical protein [Streptomyces tsukubensis]|uniref:hypothetical protein n=1 Tax=Streptomyces tsukubensis TaxID=83656 RepID=UPI00344B8845